MKEVSAVDRRTKYCVYGWMREMEKELDLGYIPPIISSICILYYRGEEIFKTTSDKIEISKEGKCIKSTAAGWIDHCGYGITKISSMSGNFYQWDIRIHEQSRNMFAIRFGISSQADILRYDGILQLLGGHYTYLYQSGRVFHNPEEKFKGYKQAESLKTGDKLSLCLDLRKKELTFMINDKCIEQKCENIKVGEDVYYRLIVSICQQNDCVEIINFTQK